MRSYLLTATVTAILVCWACDWIARHHVRPDTGGPWPRRLPVVTGLVGGLLWPLTVTLVAGIAVAALLESQADRRG